MYLSTENEVYRSRHSKVRAQTAHTNTLFYSCDLDLDLDSITLICDLDLDILKMYLHTKNEVSS